MKVKLGICICICICERLQLYLYLKLQWFHFTFVSAWKSLSWRVRAYPASRSVFFQRMLLLLCCWLLLTVAIVNLLFLLIVVIDHLILLLLTIVNWMPWSGWRWRPPLPHSASPARPPLAAALKNPPGCHQSISKPPQEKVWNVFAGLWPATNLLLDLHSCPGGISFSPFSSSSSSSSVVISAS